MCGLKNSCCSCGRCTRNIQKKKIEQNEKAFSKKLNNSAFTTLDLKEHLNSKYL